MKKLALALVAIGALATVTAAGAAACHGSGHHDAGRYTRNAAFEKLTGTGSGFRTDSASASGALAGNPLDGGNFSASLSPDWSNASLRPNGGSCAPTTGTLSLIGADSSNTIADSLRGVTCTASSNSHGVAAVFFGRAKVTNATGSVSNVTGYGRVALVEKTDGTVRGFSFSGLKNGNTHQPDTFNKR